MVTTARSPRISVRQRGSSLLLVLVLLTVAILGALMFARLSESTTALTGNVAYRDGAVQAAEAGLSDAFNKTKVLGTDAQGKAVPAQLEANNGGWYFALRLGDDAKNLPMGVNWGTATSLKVGVYTVKYIVERMCTGTLPVVDVQQSCLTEIPALGGSAKAGVEVLDAAPVTQYRVTLQTTGPKNTLVYTQAALAR